MISTKPLEQILKVKIKDCRKDGTFNNADNETESQILFYGLFCKGTGTAGVSARQIDRFIKNPLQPKGQIADWKIGNINEYVKR